MPSGKGNRIQKPLTAKQRAQALAYRDSHPLIPKQVDTAPASSWWAEPKAQRSREEFDAKVAERRHQMNPATLPGVRYQGSGIGE